MAINRSKYASNDKALHFDFEEWAALYKASPQAFEERRLKWSEQLINRAPRSCQRRLRGLLFQINMEKRRSKNALDSCMRLSGLMWDKVYNLNNQLHKLIQISTVSSPCTSNTNIQILEPQTEPGIVYKFPTTVKTRKK